MEVYVIGSIEPSQEAERRLKTSCPPHMVPAGGGFTAPEVYGMVIPASIGKEIQKTKGMLALYRSGKGDSYFVVGNKILKRESVDRLSLRLMRPHKIVVRKRVGKVIVCEVIDETCESGSEIETLFSATQ